MADKVLVVFHAKCLDGLACASIVRTALGKDRVELFPALYRTPPPNMKGRIVYIVDFSWKPSVLLPAIAEAEKVVMIDHHETAYKDWKGVELPEHLQYIYGDLVSGCALTWRFFHETHLPMQYQLVQDFDLHAGKFENSHQYAAGLSSTGMLDTNDVVQFEHWVNNVPLQEVIDRGTVAMEINDTHINGIFMRASTMIQFAGFTVPIANLPYQFATRGGNILCQGHPFSITYEDQLPDNVRKFDLRSSKDSFVHCGEIARMMGGGGHEHAASFYMPIADADAMFQYLSVFQQRPPVDQPAIVSAMASLSAQSKHGEAKPDPTLKDDVQEFVVDGLVEDYSQVLTTLHTTYMGPGAVNAASLFTNLIDVVFPSIGAAILKKVKENLRS